MTKTAHQYIKQSVMLIVAISLLSLLYILLRGDQQVMVVPLAVTAIFQLLSCMLYGLAWKRIAINSPDSISTLYMSASGFRLLAGAIVVMMYCFLAGDRAAIRFFIIVFLLYYFIVLIYDTAYFIKVEKKSKRI